MSKFNLKNKETKSKKTKDSKFSSSRNFKICDDITNGKLKFGSKEYFKEEGKNVVEQTAGMAVGVGIATLLTHASLAGIKHYGDTHTVKTDKKTTNF